MSRRALRAAADGARAHVYPPRRNPAGRGPIAVAEAGSSFSVRGPSRRRPFLSSPRTSTPLDRKPDGRAMLQRVRPPSPPGGPSQVRRGRLPCCGSRSARPSPACRASTSSAASSIAAGVVVAGDVLRVPHLHRPDPPSLRGRIAPVRPPPPEPERATTSTRRGLTVRRRPPRSRRRGRAHCRSAPAGCGRAGGAEHLRVLRTAAPRSVS